MTLYIEGVFVIVIENKPRLEIKRCTSFECLTLVLKYTSRNLTSLFRGSNSHRASEIREVSRR
jgi:hypothetical protein